MCDTTTIKDKEGELMKRIKLKELIATAKDPATQQIAIAENYTLYVVPLFEGLVKGQQPRPNRFAGYRRGLRGNP